MSHLEPAPAPTTWITIGQYTTTAEAMIAKATLEGVGIPCRLLDDTIVGFMPHLSQALGGIKLQVGPEERHLAEEVLHEAFEAPPEAQDEPDASEADEMLPRETDKDAMARRAWNAAVLGFFLPVALHALSVVCLARLPWQSGSLSRQGKRRLVSAAVVDLVVLVAITAVIGTIMAAPR